MFARFCKQSFFQYHSNSPFGFNLSTTFQALTLCSDNYLAEIRFITKLCEHFHAFSAGSILWLDVKTYSNNLTNLKKQIQFQFIFLHPHIPTSANPHISTSPHFQLSELSAAISRPKGVTKRSHWRSQ